MKSLILILVSALIAGSITYAMMEQENQTARDIQSIIVAVNGGH